jgi:hypothetical protein
LLPGARPLRERGWNHPRTTKVCEEETQKKEKENPSQTLQCITSKRRCGENLQIITVAIRQGGTPARSRKPVLS